MPNDNQRANTPGHDGDNLETIQGIGPKFAGALQRIGIRNFAELVAYTPALLAQTLFEQTGVKVSPQRIEAQDWIGQAAVFAGQALAASDSAQAMNDSVVGEALPPSSDSTWCQQAGFSLFFDYMLDERGEQVWQTRVWRTRAYHDETGEEAQFPGIAPVPWVEWILEQANLLTIAAPAAEDAEAVAPLLPEPGADLKLDILDVSIEEPAASTGAGERKLVATVRFTLSGSKAESVVAEQNPYQVEYHTISTVTGDNQLVASERAVLQPKTLDYISQQSFPIPEIGTYELQSIVLVLPPSAALAVHQGPTLHVVP